MEVDKELGGSGEAVNNPDSMPSLQAQIRRLCPITLLGACLSCAALGCMMAKRPGGGAGTDQEDPDQITVPAEPEATVPTEPAGLFTFLTDGGYLGFPRQAGVHPPLGPHGFGGIRVFYDTTLNQSLATPGFAQHPEGAAAIAELYDASGVNLMGWAVSVKTSAYSDGGFGWYWYEVASTNNPNKLVGQGVGLGQCIGCHAAGEDYVLSAVM